MVCKHTRNYLRVRGEYPLLHTASAQGSELPPRARRIPSTCGMTFFPTRNYLRVRGEYRSEMTALIPCPELPPRARRIHRCYAGPRMILGTTSACAENTAFGTLYMGSDWNYLRVRGEYYADTAQPQPLWELPPRARRIHMMDMDEFRANGTTSACAENTAGDTSARSNSRNYLRVRGEYLGFRSRIVWLAELPPRARRIHCSTCAGSEIIGTTSACAENTWLLSGHGSPLRNYLRVRGEYPK